MYFLWIVMLYCALSSFELGICPVLLVPGWPEVVPDACIVNIDEFQNVSLSTEVLVLLFGYNRESKRCFFPNRLACPFAKF